MMSASVGGLRQRRRRRAAAALQRTLAPLGRPTFSPLVYFLLAPTMQCLALACELEPSLEDRLPGKGAACMLSILLFGAIGGAQGSTAAQIQVNMTRGARSTRQEAKISPRSCPAWNPLGSQASKIVL